MQWGTNVVDKLTRMLLRCSLAENDPQSTMLHFSLNSNTESGCSTNDDKDDKKIEHVWIPGEGVVAKA